MYCFWYPCNGIIVMVETSILRKEEKSMYLTVKQQVKNLSKDQYGVLRELSHTAKNLANEAIYNIRQHFFATGGFLNYESNYKLLKTSENYRLLNSNMAQQILKEVDGMFKSFFGQLKLAKEGKYDSRKVRIPQYLPKDGFTTLVIGMVRLNGNELILPYSRSYGKQHSPVVFKIPPVLSGKTVKEIRIIPKADARFFEVQYNYEAECAQREPTTPHVLALDFGVDNLMTAVSSNGDSFIIDGKRLKSVNQRCNKANAVFQSIKDRFGQGDCQTKRQILLWKKRNNTVNDYISKAARMVIRYCLEHDTSTLVVGYNETFQRNTNMGKRNNQTFVNIPFGKLYAKLEYLCALNGLTFVRQEEGYTSKASFWDKDDMPVFPSVQEETCHFSGTRIHRGLYRTKEGNLLNADVNGALNILRKSNVVDLSALYAKGAVNTPVRLSVFQKKKVQRIDSKHRGSTVSYEAPTSLLA